MDTFTLGDKVFSTSKPRATAHYMGVLRLTDDGAPLALRVSYLDGEYFVGLNSIFATSEAALSAAALEVDAIEVASEKETPLHLVAVAMKNAPRKRKPTPRASA